MSSGMCARIYLSFFSACKREAQLDFSVFLGSLSVRQKAWEVIFIEVLLVGLL